MPRADIEFKTSDGVTLRGWFFTPPQASASKLPCLVFGHGLSCIKEMALSDIANKLVADLPLTCLVFDYRGFGSSDTALGAPRCEIDTAQQCADLRDAITYAQMRDDVDKDKIGLWGYSLSGAHVVYLAAVDRRVKAIIAVGAGLSGTEICRRLAPPHAFTGFLSAFEADRMSRAAGEPGMTVPVVSDQPSAPSTLPSPESYAFFSQWESNGSTWRNELTLRSLEDIAGYATPIAHVKNVTPTPVLFEVATRDTNSPPDMVMSHYSLLSEPKEYILVDADHYELVSRARTVLHKKELAFLEKTICA